MISLGLLFSFLPPTAKIQVRVNPSGMQSIAPCTEISFGSTEQRDIVTQASACLDLRMRINKVIILDLFQPPVILSVLAAAIAFSKLPK